MFLVLQACIGRGAHGLVFEGETSDGKAVAVKITPVNEPHNVNELAAVSDAWGRSQVGFGCFAWFEKCSLCAMEAATNPGPSPPLTSPCL